jgi:hypothetical protein
MTEGIITIEVDERVRITSTDSRSWITFNNFSSFFLQARENDSTYGDQLFATRHLSDAQD